MLDAEFAREWRRADASVRAFCRRQTRSSADADDLCQMVALRAWRGFSTFRGNCSFLTWVLRIAERESVRAGLARASRSRREVEFDPKYGDRFAQAELPLPADSWVDRIVNDAVKCEVLSADDARLVVVRAGEPELTWTEIGDRVGASGATCAVRHCRALPRLRVFLFTDHLAEFGGHAAAERALTRAREGPEPLSPAETAVFEAVVLHGTVGYRRRGWRAALLSACAKVAPFMDLT